MDVPRAFLKSKPLAREIYAVPPCLRERIQTRGANFRNRYMDWRRRVEGGMEPSKTVVQVLGGMGHSWISHISSGRRSIFSIVSENVFGVNVSALTKNAFMR